MILITLKSLKKARSEMNVEQLHKELGILKAQGYGKSKISLSVEVEDHEQHGPVHRVRNMYDLNFVIIESGSGPLASEK